jgi:hypothetical protein
VRLRGKNTNGIWRSVRASATVRDIAHLPPARQPFDGSGCDPRGVLRSHGLAPTRISQNESLLHQAELLPASRLSSLALNPPGKWSQPPRQLGREIGTLLSKWRADQKLASLCGLSCKQSLCHRLDVLSGNPETLAPCLVVQLTGCSFDCRALTHSFLHSLRNFERRQNRSPP